MYNTVFRFTPTLANYQAVLVGTDYFKAFLQNIVVAGGAGKTTTLKCIAGVEFPQEGLVKIDGKIVNLIEPQDRNIGLAFEDYALYPPLTVYDNLAFNMRAKGKSFCSSPWV